MGDLTDLDFLNSREKLERLIDKQSTDLGKDSNKQRCSSCNEIIKEDITITKSGNYCKRCKDTYKSSSLVQ